MKISRQQLLTDLHDRTNTHLMEAKSLVHLDFDLLNLKSDANTWSVLECLEHLNLYGDFYLPEISQVIKKAKANPESVEFRSGVLGNYFAKSMLPKEKLNKMNTFKDKNPNGSNLSKEVIDRFISQQERTLKLLDKCAEIDLTRNKTAISISNFIKLRLGDTLRVLIYHNERHMVQIKKTLKRVNLLEVKPG